jgi:hypothetical protein
MKCVSTNRLVSRLVVPLLIKFEWAAHCEKPGVSWRSTTCIILTQPVNLNLNCTSLPTVQNITRGHQAILRVLKKVM